MNGCKAIGGSESGIDSPEAAVESEEVTVEWYDISGRRVVNPSKGIYFRLSRYSDGMTRTSKVLLAD